MKKIIFVIGTGRSGTHWLGNILASSEIKVNIEERPIFAWVTEAAVDYKKRNKLLPFIISYYKLARFFSKKHFADKSHPNLWLIDDLYSRLPHSYFIGIIRDPHATIASMLVHKGVLKWIHNWRDYSIPNEFLGITLKNKEEYAAMSIEEKCVLRWIAHKNKMEEVQKKYFGRVLIVNYEELCNNVEKEIGKIDDFLELEENLPKPNIKKESLDKWKENLNDTQITTINNTLKKYDLQNFVK